MGVKIPKLGGAENFPRGVPTRQDVNDSNEALVDVSVKLTTQLAYQILQANNVFENKDYLAADEFVDSNGTNNTINTTDTTSFYNTSDDKYTTIVSTKSGDFTKSTITNDLNDGASLTTDDYDTTNNTMDLRIDASSFDTYSNDKRVNKYDIGDMSGKGLNFDVVNSGSGASAMDVTHREIVRFYHGGSNEILVNSTGGGTTSIYIFDDGTTIYIYSNGSLVNSVAHTTDTYLTFEVQIDRDATGQGNPFTAYSRLEVRSNFYIGEFGDSELIADSNLMTLDASPESLGIYIDADIPDGTDIKLDVSDDSGSTWGVTDVTREGKWFFADTSALTGTDLAIKFKLSGSGATTPSIYGYGLAITR